LAVADGFSRQAWLSAYPRAVEIILGEFIEFFLQDLGEILLLDRQLINL
jgi:hypothetical protein